MIGFVLKVNKLLGDNHLDQKLPRVEEIESAFTTTNKESKVILKVIEEE